MKGTERLDVKCCTYFGGQCSCNTDAMYNECARKYSEKKIVGGYIGGQGGYENANYPGDIGTDNQKIWENFRADDMEVRGTDPAMGEIEQG